MLQPLGTSQTIVVGLYNPSRRNPWPQSVSKKTTDDMVRECSPPATLEKFKMEVILKEDVANLGHRGDVVKVAEGYGRNFLLPRKLALQATASNKAVIEQMKAAAVRRSASEKALAETLAAQLEPLTLAFTRKSGENGHLFGSVTSADIAHELETRGFEVDRRKIQLVEPIKAIGVTSVAIKLHREVTAHVKVTVAADGVPEPVATEAAVAV